MSHPRPPAAPPSGPSPHPARARILTAVSLSPATSPTDGPGFDTLTESGQGVFIPLWAIRAALERDEARVRGEGEATLDGGAATPPVPPQRFHPPSTPSSAAPAPHYPPLFPSLPLSTASTSSARSSNLTTRSMTTPSEGQVPRASFAFPSSSSSSSSLLAPAYVPPALPAPHHQTAHYPHAHAPAPTSHSTSTSTSDDDGSSVSSSAGHPLEALVGHARRGDYQARDFAYPVRDEEEEEEEGDPEWVPEGEGFAVRGSAGSSSRGRRKAVGGAAVAAEGAAAGGAGGGGGERTVSEPASEALEIRWIPSLGKFLPSDAPYPSQPSAPKTVIRFAPASHVRVWADSSRETELFPWSSSSAQRNAYLRAQVRHRFAPPEAAGKCACACGFGFLRPVASTGAGGESEWKRPSVVRDHLAKCAVLDDDDALRRMCALTRSFDAEKLLKGKGKGKQRTGG